MHIPQKHHGESLDKSRCRRTRPLPEWRRGLARIAVIAKKENSCSAIVALETKGILLHLPVQPRLPRLSAPTYDGHPALPGTRRPDFTGSSREKSAPAQEPAVRAAMARIHGSDRAGSATARPGRAARGAADARPPRPAGQADRPAVKRARTAAARAIRPRSACRRTRPARVAPTVRQLAAHLPIEDSTMKTARARRRKARLRSALQSRAKR